MQETIDTTKFLYSNKETCFDFFKWPSSDETYILQDIKEKFIKFLTCLENGISIFRKQYPCLDYKYG